MNPDEKKLEELMSKMTFDDKPDYSHRDKLEQELLAAFARRQWQQERKSRGQAGVWRAIMQNRITRFTAAAAVIVITAFAGVQFLTGTNAYAQVAEQLRKAQSVVFTTITQSNEGNGKTIKTDIAYKEPGHFRSTTVDGYIAIADFISGKMMSIVPQGGYSIGDLNILKSTGNSGFFASIEAMKKLPAKADETLDPKEIDGIVCRGYKVRQEDLTTTVWLDVKTGELVQVEQKYASAPGMNKIIKNIKFDEVLDDSLFSLTPPAGYKPMGVEMKSDAAIQTEETFIAWLGWWANGNTDEAFPPIVAGTEMAKVCMDMAKQGKLKGASWDKVDPSKMFNALLFVAKLPTESNWRYAGNGVKINTPDTPIFWYRPAGSQMYRVIYADLTIHEMAEDQLPK